MNIERLNHYLTFSKNLNLTQSANLLNISPAALSKSLKKFESEIGAKLFTQGGKKFYLTQQGEILKLKGEYLLSEIDKVKTEVLIQQKKQNIKIATFEVFSTYFLKGFYKENEFNSQLQIYDSHPGDIEGLVANSHVDLGITCLPIAHPDVEHLRITSLEMGVFTKQNAFTGIQQKDLPFVIPIKPLLDNVYHAKGLDNWPADAYKRTIKYEVSHLESALELCRLGLAAGYFPLFIVRLHNEHVKAEFQLERRKSPYGNRTCVTDIYIVKRKNDVENSLHKKVARIIRKTC